MLRIIQLDGSRALHSFFHVAKGDQAPARGQVIAESRIFGKHGTPAREIARAAVAEPPSLQLAVRGLGTQDFGARPLDVATIRGGRPGDAVRVNDAPPVTL